MRVLQDVAKAANEAAKSGGLTDKEKLALFGPNGNDGICPSIMTFIDKPGHSTVFVAASSLPTSGEIAASLNAIYDSGVLPKP